MSGVLGALLCIAALSSCGKKAAENTPADGAGAVAVEAPAPEAAAPAETAAPQPEASIDVPALLAEIAGAEDMIAWYQVRSTYQAAKKPVPEVDAALAAREAELLATAPAIPFSVALDLLALDWKLDETSSAEGKEETFIVTWLFRTKQPVSIAEGHDVKLVLRGWFDKAHQAYFKEGEKYIELTYGLTPPLTEWEAGSYQMVSNKTYRKLPNVPYRIHTYFSELEKKEDGSFSYVGRLGESVDTGWHADLGAGVAVPPAQ